MPDEQRRLAAIMFTDMVGYSGLAQRDEALALELLEEHRELVRAILPRFQGNEIKTMGDAFLVEFRSALAATQCAVEIQRTLAKRNHDVARERQIELKIGIHLGDVLYRDGDVYGDGVNIAARIEPVAGAGGICVSEDVERQIRTSLEIRLEKLAPTELKNITLSIALYRVALPWEKGRGAALPKERAREAVKPRLPIWAAAALFVLLLASGVVWLFWNRSQPGARATASATAATSRSAPAKSVAVLPFVNMSAEKENEYLSDGITEDLCTALTQVKGLRVPARTSSFAFKGKTEDIRKVGEQLNVATVLEGSVAKAGNKLRITAQLINVADGFHLWASNYDREMTDILDIRSDISRRVVDALKVQLGVEETERLAKRPTENLRAYELYLLGRHELNKFGEAGFRQSVQHFEEAMALDPTFALAAAGLAEAFNMLGMWNYLPPKEAFPRGRKAAEQALQLDPALAEAHTALAFVDYEFGWRYAEAEWRFREAIRLNPGSAPARMWFAEFLLARGRFQEAEEEIARAAQLDPLSVRISFARAVKLLFERQFEAAIAQAEKTVAVDPQNGLTYDFLGQVFHLTNRPADAFRAWERTHVVEGVFSPDERAEMRAAYETGGLPAFLRVKNELMQRRRGEGKYQSPLRIAQNYINAGAKEEALAWLEIAVEERAPWLPELQVDASWDALRSEPRFIAVLRKVGL